MVCTASDLHGWKDFPKGLRVLLLDGDSNSAAEIKTKLEEMEYVGESYPCSSHKMHISETFDIFMAVVTYCNENDALLAISSEPEMFHVAIVEVMVDD